MHGAPFCVSVVVACGSLRLSGEEGQYYVYQLNAGFIYQPFTVCSSWHPREKESMKMFKHSLIEIYLTGRDGAAHNEVDKTFHPCLHNGRLSLSAESQSFNIGQSNPYTRHTPLSRQPLRTHLPTRAPNITARLSVQHCYMSPVNLQLGLSVIILLSQVFFHTPVLNVLPF